MVQTLFLSVAHPDKPVLVRSMPCHMFFVDEGLQLNRPNGKEISNVTFRTKKKAKRLSNTSVDGSHG